MPTSSSAVVEAVPAAGASGDGLAISAAGSRSSKGEDGAAVGPLAPEEDLLCCRLETDVKLDDQALTQQQEVVEVADVAAATGTAAAARDAPTPEQEAAAARLAEDFVSQYEQAFLGRAVQQLAEACAASGLPEAFVAQKLRGRGIDLAQLQARAAEVQRGIAECASDEGWRLIQDGKLRLLYRHQPGSTVHSFKGSCVLPAPMEQPLSMAREFDLVKTWNTYITHSPILKTFCDVDLLVYASVWLPWPFAERDVLISAVADDQLKERGVVAVSFASPHETPADVELPPGADQRVHIFFSEGSCMTLTPLAAPGGATVAPASSGGGAAPASSGQETRVTIVSNIDTRMRSVPEAIISFVLRVFAPFMYKTVLSVLHKSFDDPSEPLPQRMAAHHELYDRMRQRCRDFIDGHPQ